MNHETRNRSRITILGVLILSLSVLGCHRTASKNRIRLLDDYAKEKTKEIEGRREFEHISISYTSEQGGKLWVIGFVPEDKEDELKALLQTDLSPEEIVWKVKALDSESFQNVQVIDMAEEPREAPTLTAEDLARALGMNWWEVTLPDDLPPNSRMGLVVKDSDGAIIHKTPGFWTRSLPGRRFKVIVWDSSDGMSLNYAAMDSKTRFSGPSIPKTEAMQGAARNISERKREMGDLLMKFCTIGGAGGTEELRRGDIGLSLDIVGTEEAAPEE